MLLFKYLVKLVKLLNSETSSRALALAFSLGMFLGFVPLLSLQGLLAVAIVLFFRVNLFATFLTFCVFGLVHKALRGPFDALGVALLENSSLTGVWTWFYNTPGVSMMGTNHSVMLASSIVGILLLLPFFFFSRSLIDRYRVKMSERWAQFGVVQAFRGSWVYRIYSWFDSPFH